MAWTHEINRAIDQWRRQYRLDAEQREAGQAWRATCRNDAEAARVALETLQTFGAVFVRELADYQVWQDHLAEVERVRAWYLRWYGEQQQPGRPPLTILRSINRIRRAHGIGPTPAARYIVRQFGAILPPQDRDALYTTTPDFKETVDLFVRRLKAVKE